MKQFHFYYFLLLLTQAFIFHQLLLNQFCQVDLKKKKKDTRGKYADSIREIQKKKRCLFLCMLAHFAGILGTGCKGGNKTRLKFFQIFQRWNQRKTSICFFAGSAPGPFFIFFSAFLFQLDFDFFFSNWNWDSFLLVFLNIFQTNFFFLNQKLQWNW